jgi:hypothetical protein
MEELMYNEMGGQQGAPMEPEADMLADQGRFGDAEMAHVARGDFVIPKDIVDEHPEFLTKLQKIFQDRDDDYRTHMVGSGFERRNPQTGSPEFFSLGKALKKAAGAVTGAVSRGAKSIGHMGEAAINDPMQFATGRYNPIVAQLGAAKGFLGGGGMSGLARGAKEANLMTDAGGLMNMGMAGGIGGGAGGGTGGGGAGDPFSFDSLGGGAMPQFGAPGALPASLQGRGMSPEQIESYLGTKGLYGGGLAAPEKSYYENLMGRAITSGGAGSTMPISRDYTSRVGNPMEYLRSLKG